MRFKEFKVGDKSIKDPIEISKILIENNLSWLVDSEIEDADVEIINKTLIWNKGKYYAGKWHFGIWKDGYFYGTWDNGIWEKGNFEGKWISGIKSK